MIGEKKFFMDISSYRLYHGKKNLRVGDEELHLHRGGAEETKRVVGDGRGGRHDEDAVRQSQAVRSEADVGHDDAHTREKKAQAAGAVEKKAAKIRVKITARRIRIDPEERRSRYILRLEALIEELDGIIANSRVSRKLRLRAMEILIKAINTCYGIVSDVEVEALERELEEAKEEEEAALQGEGAKELGYEIEEDPAG